MKIYKAELSQKISKLKSVVPKATPIAALQGILLRDGYLIASNTETVVKTRIGDDSGESFIIPSKAFDLIANMPDGEMEIACAEGIVTIRAASIVNSYQTLDTGLFPLPEAMGKDANGFKADSSEVLASMRRVIYAVSARDANTKMTAMCLKANGGRLDFVGLDGHIIAWDQVRHEGDFELLVPRAAVERLLSIGASGDMDIRYNKNWAVFSTGEYEIHTRLVEGEYFRYEKMFMESPLHTSIRRQGFLSAMTRAKMCIEEKIPALFNIVGDEMEISANGDTARYQETLILEKPVGGRLRIGFNPRLVIDSLKAFDCELVGLDLDAPNKPMVMKDPEREFKALVLPVAVPE